MRLKDVLYYKLYSISAIQDVGFIMHCDLSSTGMLTGGETGTL